MKKHGYYVGTLRGEKSRFNRCQQPIILLVGEGLSDMSDTAESDDEF